MNNHIKTIVALIVCALFIYSFVTAHEIYSTYNNQQSQEEPHYLRKGERLVSTFKKSLVALKNNSAQDTLSLTTPSPFKVRKVPKRVITDQPKIDFDRVPLVLKGIMEGKKRVVLLKERSGKTHPLMQGESVHERKIIKITANSVILKDKLGNDTLFVE